MPSLDSIKKRIKSVQTISKITNAMKLVASAKIKKQRKLYDSTSEFTKMYYYIMYKLTQDINSFDFLLESKNKEKTKFESNLYVVITSSLGLCGAFNTNICKKVLAELKPNDKLVIFGKKGIAYFRARVPNQIFNEYEYEPNILSYYSILPMCYRIAKNYTDKQVLNIKLAYTKFVNSLKFDPLIVDLFPMNKQMFELSLKVIDQLDSANSKKKDRVLTIYEPSKEEIIKNTLPVYVSTICYGALVESTLCENSSRRNAMDNASKNASEIIDNLFLNYNRARQDTITQELIEIIAGANANSK